MAASSPLARAHHRLPTGGVVGGGFKVVRHIGEGTYSDIYEATADNTLVALKVDKDCSNPHMLEKERNVMRALAATGFVPRVLGHGHLPDKRGYLAMTLLGEDVSSLRYREAKRCLSVKRAALYGKGMLDALAAFHAAGFVHRDVKPSNFLVPRGHGDEDTKVEPVCYVVDFGLARRHLDESTGVPLPPRDRCQFRGTHKYASCSMHELREAGRVDDLWSLLYVIVDLLLPRGVPWKGMGDHKREVLLMKKQFASEQLAQRLPAPMQRFMAHLSTLSYADAPDYDLLRAQLDDLHEAAAVDVFCTATFPELDQQRNASVPKSPARTPMTSPVRKSVSRSKSTPHKTVVEEEKKEKKKQKERPLNAVAQRWKAGLAGKAVCIEAARYPYICRREEECGCLHPPPGEAPRTLELRPALFASGYCSKAFRGEHDCPCSRRHLSSEELLTFALTGVVRAPPVPSVRPMLPADFNAAREVMQSDVERAFTVLFEQGKLRKSAVTREVIAALERTAVTAAINALSVLAMAPRANTHELLRELQQHDRAVRGIATRRLDDLRRLIAPVVAQPSASSSATCKPPATTPVRAPSNASDGLDSVLETLGLDKMQRAAAPRQPQPQPQPFVSGDNGVGSAPPPTPWTEGEKDSSSDEKKKKKEEEHEVVALDDSSSSSSDDDDDVPLLAQIIQKQKKRKKPPVKMKPPAKRTKKAARKPKTKTKKKKRKREEDDDEEEEEEDVMPVLHDDDDDDDDETSSAASSEEEDDSSSSSEEEEEEETETEAAVEEGVYEEVFPTRPVLRLEEMRRWSEVMVGEIVPEEFDGLREMKRLMDAGLMEDDTQLRELIAKVRAKDTAGACTRASRLRRRRRKAE